MSELRLLKTLPVENSLGESVLWDHRSGAFLWTDILERRLFRYRPAEDRLDRWETPERLCSFGLVEGDEGLLIAAFESGVANYRFDTGDVEWLARPEAEVRGTRFNDGRVDRQGRFWAGTMVEGKGAIDAEGREVSANLYRVDRGECTRVESGVRISNSLAWSLDSRRQYFADSPSRTIFRYTFDPENGRPTDRTIFARTAAPAEPDGSCTDAEDHLWNAEWRGWRVVRYHPDGNPVMALRLPVAQPTCVAFGGPDLTWLAVTSATVDLTAQEREAQPLAGALFLFESPVRGVQEPLYRRRQPRGSPA